MTLVQLLQKIHHSNKGDTLEHSGIEYIMMTDVVSDYDSSEYVSFHDVVLQADHMQDEKTYYRMVWQRTKEDDPEIVEDSVEASEVRPVTVTTTDWVPLKGSEHD